MENLLIEFQCSGQGFKGWLHASEDDIDLATVVSIKLSFEKQTWLLWKISTFGEAREI